MMHISICEIRSFVSDALILRPGQLPISWSSALTLGHIKTSQLLTISLAPFNCWVLDSACAFFFIISSRSNLQFLASFIRSGLDWTLSFSFQFDNRMLTLTTQLTTSIPSSPGHLFLENALVQGRCPDPSYLYCHQLCARGSGRSTRDI